MWKWWVLTVFFCPKNLVLSLLASVCSYSEICSLGSESRSQFSIIHRGRLKQMEIEPINFRDHQPISFLDAWCSAFCFKDFFQLVSAYIVGKPNSFSKWYAFQYSQRTLKGNFSLSPSKYIQLDKSKSILKLKLGKLNHAIQKHS